MNGLPTSSACLAFALIPLIPMVFIPDIGKLFLNYTMQNTGVRVEKVTIYLKEPYASLVELPKTTTKALSEQQIFKIKEVNILFQGVGKNTLLSYRLNGHEQKISFQMNLLLWNNVKS
ncbi:hypothetical protein [Acinetobacter soli]|uniref:hypothetical protein n=1 Tax=Acinetobacter soli TaxID=487316 RepID=UPI00301982F2